MKPGRQSIIMEIISEQAIETQNQLLEALTQRGIKSTQATLSRDIKELRLVKKMGNDGHYRYAAPARLEDSDSGSRLKTILRESIISYSTAQNILVIKTLPGLAPAACSAFDSMNIPKLVGTLAGDDTGFLALTDNAAAEALERELESIF